MWWGCWGLLFIRACWLVIEISRGFFRVLGFTCICWFHENACTVSFGGGSIFYFLLLPYRLFVLSCKRHQVEWKTLKRPVGTMRSCPKWCRRKSNGKCFNRDLVFVMYRIPYKKEVAPIYTKDIYWKQSALGIPPCVDRRLIERGWNVSNIWRGILKMKCVTSLIGLMPYRRDIRGKLRKTQVALKQAKRKDYYKVHLIHWSLVWMVAFFILYDFSKYIFFEISVVHLRAWIGHSVSG